jgi:hypothetical protein
MPDSPPKSVYLQVLDKYDWAVKHVDKFKVAHREWRDANPIAVRTEKNPESGEVTYYVENVPTVPSSLPLIAGDALQCFRGALDYLACGLVEVVTPDTKFPIAHNADAYKSSLGRLVPGFRGEALETLNRIRPYQGGDLLLWQLHRLNIIDKHRLLLAVCVVNPMKRFPPNQALPQDSTLVEQVICKPKDGIQIVVHFVKDAPIPLHAGQKLLTLSASEAQEEIGFYFAVGFSEPGLAEGVTVDMFLDFVATRVGHTIAKLAPFILR